MEKTREEILQERKFRKIAKLSKKKKSDGTNVDNKSENADSVVSSNNSINIEKKQLEIINEDVKSKNIDLQLNNLSTENFKPEENLFPSGNSKIVIENAKSKAQLRAERRAKQEAQRASKDVLKKLTDEKTEEKSSSRNKFKAKENVEDSKSLKNTEAHKIKLFSHLYRNASVEESKILANSSSQIHKAVIKLGLQYKNKIIIGSNARVVALLNMLKQVLADYQRPADKDFSRGFEIVLSDSITYLQNYRPMSVSMSNAIKYFKLHLSQIPNNITDNQAQAKLREAIDDYIKEQIDMAGKAICYMVQRKISEDDIILTFGYSSLIQRILTESFKSIKFRVIIVDSGPLYEGKELLKRLVKCGLNCTYVLLSATSYIMKEANKVLLGAHALLTNGYVMSRAGSSQVALIAKSFNVPVLVCCETHKFCERVQTDTFVYNELGNSDKLIKTENWISNKFLTPLTLMYDVTPSDLITAVVTELAVLPCTSVPVVLRVKPANSIFC